MLVEILIEQFALVEKVRLSLGGGLHVLTGETGAGKSIIIDAVEAALGGRTSQDVIRTGEERAVIEALFDLGSQPARAHALREQGIEVAEDGLLLVRRELHRGGRSAIRVNGRLATAGMLRAALDGLIDLHGQHEHQLLLQVDRHGEMLDEYGGSPLLSLREELGRTAGQLRAVRSELRELLGDERDRARREDLLRFQVEELRAAGLVPGEEEELAAERRVLLSAERLRAAADEAYALLYDGTPRQMAATDQLGRAQHLLGEAARIDPSLAPLLDLLDGAAIQVREAAHAISSYRQRVEADPQRLARVEARLDLLHSLKRKYGDSVAEMVAYLGEVERELERLERSEQLVQDLRGREERLGAEAARLAAALTAARRQAAAAMAREAAAHLGDLGMPGAQFVRAVEPVPAAPGRPAWEAVGPRGWDRVEFLFSPNAGEPPKPLSRIASGGEMSRIMLALKVVLAHVDGVPTLIFDEVDTGISGRAAQAVGEKLARIARDRQVLCVSHLPQIAALADVHLLVSKAEGGGRTVTRLTALDAEGRASEIARMVSGTVVTALSLENARELLRQAENVKERLRPA